MIQEQNTDEVVLEYINGSNCSRVYKLQKNKQDIGIVLKRVQHVQGKHRSQCIDLWNEYKIMSQLSHPNILEVLGQKISNLNQTDQCCEIQLKQAKCDLYQYLTSQSNNKQSLNVYEQKLKIIYQLASALNYLHTEKNIAHNDIKLANVFLDEYNNVLLADFGFAYSNPESLQVSDQIKRFQNRRQFYLAPELYQLITNQEFSSTLSQDKKVVDEKKSDIFNLGVVAFQLFYFQDLNVTDFSDSDVKFKVFYKETGLNLINKVFLEGISSIKKLTEFYIEISKNKYRDFLALLVSLLHYNPDCRPSLESVLKSEVFSGIIQN